MAYTKEEEETLNEYPGASVADIAQRLGKSTRSVIAKLSNMGVYQTKAKTTKAGDPIISKLELVAEIEEKLGAEFPTLAKAGKEDLRKLVELL
jgi:Mn-dependent DtxR family transcriptional regulator